MNRVICWVSGNRINPVMGAIEDGGGSQLPGARSAGVSMRAEKANLKFIANYSWNVIFSTRSLESQRRDILLQIILNCFIIIKMNASSGPPPKFE